MTALDFSVEGMETARALPDDAAEAVRITAPGVYELAPSAYHADPCPTPSLSSSLARTLLDRSALHAWKEHPRLGGGGVHVEADHIDRGSLIHRLVLGAGSDVEVVDAKDWRTSAARAARDGARSVGHIPVLRADYEDARIAAKEITARLSAFGVELGGVSERTIAWQEQTAYGEIWCRGMLDHIELRSGRAVVYDLKTSRSAHPRSCARHVIDYGYDVQRAAYVQGVERVLPQYAGRIDYVWLFVELEPPYAVLPAVADALMRERGVRRWDDACSRWAACLSRESWPSYWPAPRPCVLESPGWLLSSEEASNG